MSLVFLDYEVNSDYIVYETVYMLFAANGKNF